MAAVTATLPKNRGQMNYNQNCAGNDETAFNLHSHQVPVSILQVRHIKSSIQWMSDFIHIFSDLISVHNWLETQTASRVT